MYLQPTSLHILTFCVELVDGEDGFVVVFYIPSLVLLLIKIILW